MFSPFSVCSPKGTMNLKNLWTWGGQAPYLPTRRSAVLSYLCSLRSPVENCSIFSHYPERKYKSNIEKTLVNIAGCDRENKPLKMRTKNRSDELMSYVLKLACFYLSQPVQTIKFLSSLVREYSTPNRVSPSYNSFNGINRLKFSIQKTNLIKLG